jgi:malonyl-CoA/methylmalonyl-CoA synthetase
MNALLIDRARQFGRRTAIVSGEKTITYADLLEKSHAIASTLLGRKKDLGQERVVLLARPQAEYVLGQWGIWRAGGVVVPLCPDHPAAEMQYVIADSRPVLILAEKHFAPLIEPLAKELRRRVVWIEDALNADARWLPDLTADRRALMLYTSGTTSRPKGVVTTHGNIAAQITMLVKAWQWTKNDRIVNFLPLHHIHGVINILGCAFWSGASVEMLGGFDADRVWQKLIAGDATLFMAVPTIYTRLTAAWEKASPPQRKAMTAACKKLRLMVSGSAALPVSTLKAWRKISGHDLLERYGMTETGMLLSNSYTEKRHPGCVGKPLPTVKVRLINDEGKPAKPGTPGEIQVKGPGIFLEYWRQLGATRESFQGGWFRTGDVAVLENGVYRILGRSSIDIIKTGGYKVSAIEIEEVLREHPDIDQCAVVGIEDPEWGQRVAAAVVVKRNGLTLDTLRSWAKQRMGVYKVPTLLKLLPDLPRNAMGKVVKPTVQKMF